MHACTSGPVTGRHWSGSSLMARRRRKSLHAHALCCCRVAGSARIASSARLGYRSRRFGAGRKPTWMVASSACSRTGARARAPAKSDRDAGDGALRDAMCAGPRAGVRGGPLVGGTFSALREQSDNGRSWAACPKAAWLSALPSHLADPRSDPQGPRHRRDPQQADPAALDVITQQCPSRRAQRLVPGRQGPCSRISQRHNQRRRSSAAASSRRSSSFTRVTARRIAHCRHCGTDLSSVAQTPFHAYDHIELPPIKPDVTRVTLYRGLCPCCGQGPRPATKR